MPSCLLLLGRLLCPAAPWLLCPAAVAHGMVCVPAGMKLATVGNHLRVVLGFSGGWATRRLGAWLEGGLVDT